jgi:hypothetical protein
MWCDSAARAANASLHRGGLEMAADLRDGSRGRTAHASVGERFACQRVRVRDCTSRLDRDAAVGGRSRPLREDAALGVQLCQRAWVAEGSTRAVVFT